MSVTTQTQPKPPSPAVLPPPKQPEPSIPEKPFPPERITLCIDITADMNKHWIFNGHKLSKLESIKSLVAVFMNAKKTINTLNEFAILLATTSTFWLCDFTSDINSIMEKVDQLDAQDDFTSFDLSSVFRRIRERMPPETVKPVKSIDFEPKFVYRCILIYGRTTIIPVIKSAMEDLLALQSSPFFFYDIVYIHEKDSKAQAVYDGLLAAEAKDKTSWAYDSQNSKILSASFTQLLCHPLIRPVQSMYKTHLL